MREFAQEKNSMVQNTWKMFKPTGIHKNVYK